MRGLSPACGAAARTVYRTMTALPRAYKGLGELVPLGDSIFHSPFVIETKSGGAKKRECLRGRAVLPVWLCQRQPPSLAFVHSKNEL
jgi:hypothetical protein